MKACDIFSLIWIKEIFVKLSNKPKIIKQIMNVFMRHRNITNLIKLLITVLLIFILLLKLANIDYGSHLEIVTRNKFSSKNRFLIELSKMRLDKLFRILQKKENDFKDSLYMLQVFSFSDLISQEIDSNIKFELKNEINKYLEIENQEIRAKNALVVDLINRSNFYAFENSKLKSEMKNFSKVIFAFSCSKLKRSNII